MFESLFNYNIMTHKIHILLIKMKSMTYVTRSDNNIY